MVAEYKFRKKSQNPSSHTNFIIVTSALFTFSELNSGSKKINPSRLADVSITLIILLKDLFFNCKNSRSSDFNFKYLVISEPFDL